MDCQAAAQQAGRTLERHKLGLVPVLVTALPEGL
jgi:hypothetical protein